MNSYKFDEVVDIVKVSRCPTCSTYTYTLPCTLDVDFESYIKPMGRLAYPLNKIKSIVMDNADIRLRSRVGRLWLEVKFKNEEVQPLFNAHIAGYIEDKNNIIIEL